MNAIRKEERTQLAMDSKILLMMAYSKAKKRQLEHTLSDSGVAFAFFARLFCLLLFVDGKWSTSHVVRIVQNSIDRRYCSSAQRRRRPLVSSPPPPLFLPILLYHRFLYCYPNPSLV